MSEYEQPTDQHAAESAVDFLIVPHDAPVDVEFPDNP